MTETPKPIVFLDTETDGLHPKRQAWEIAMIRRDFHSAGSWTETTAHMFVDIDLDQADPYALKVGGFYDRHPMGQWLSSLPSAEPDDVWPPRALREELEVPSVAAKTVARLTHGAQIVGVVPNFDAELLERLLREHGDAPAWDYHLIDVRAMALGWCLAAGQNGAIPDPSMFLDPSMSSDKLAERCGVVPATEAERHTALGDARWAMRWYDAITGGAR